MLNRCAERDMEFLFGAWFEHVSLLPRSAQFFDSAFESMCAAYADMHPGYKTWADIRYFNWDEKDTEVAICCGKCP